MVKRLAILILFFSLLSAQVCPAYAADYIEIPIFLCEIAINLFYEGLYDEALHELNNALIVSPNHPLALAYIEIVKKGIELEKDHLDGVFPKKGIIEKALDTAESKLSYVKAILKPKPASVVEIVSKPVVVRPPAIPSQTEAKGVLSEEKVICPVSPTGDISTIPRQKEPAIPAEKRVVSNALDELPSQTEAKGVLSEEKVISPILTTGDISISPGKKESITSIKKRVVSKVLDELQSIGVLGGATKKSLKKVYPPKIILLDSSLEQTIFPIKIEQGKPYIFEGKNIKKFLVTNPDSVNVKQISPDQLLLEPTNFGVTYMHIWDEYKRWTVELATVPAAAEGISYADMLRLTGNIPGTFKLDYSLDWSSSRSGRDFSSLGKGTDYYTHLLELSGDCPYGTIDTVAAGRASSAENNTIDINRFSFALRNGKFGQFEGFSLYAFDFTPNPGSYANSGSSLWGAMLSSPAFGDKIRWSAFRGQENTSVNGRSLLKAKMVDSDLFSEGIKLNWLPTDNQKYGFSLTHGWSKNRESGRDSYGYDWNLNWDIDKIELGYELGYDSEYFANLLTLGYKEGDKLTLDSALRVVSKKYQSVSGGGGPQGQVGNLFNLSYIPSDNFRTNFSLDVYKDRLNPAKDNNRRLNESLMWNAEYKIDSKSSVNLDYSFQDYRGYVSPSLFQSAGAGFRRSFKILSKDISSFISYSHRISEYFISEGSSSIGDRVSLGGSLNLGWGIYYYLNQEFNWLRDTKTGTLLKPKAFQTGMNWHGTIFNPAVSTNVGCFYRREEGASSPLSLLAGADSLSLNADIVYAFSPRSSIYFSAGTHNMWPKGGDVQGNMSFNTNAGIHYFWDTGIRWDAIGDIEGWVFKDLDLDGIRDDGEQGVKDVKLSAGKDKYAFTDDTGYYKLKNVRAKAVVVMLDSSSLPSGFVPSSSASPEIRIAHGKAVKLDFGLSTRSEIYGTVFVDLNKNGKLDPGDKALQDVKLTLNNGISVKTDGTGRYYFRKLEAGKYKLTLGINSIPTEYIPLSPIYKDIELFEGFRYSYDIILNKIE